MNFRLMIVAVGLTVALVACGDDDSEGDPENQAENHESYEGPTYYGDIKPLMEEHCTDCHVADAVAPFPLQTYESVKATAPLSLTTMESGTMPPWPPADDCGSFQGHRGIDADAIDIFQEWIDGDFAEGDADDSNESDESALVTPEGTPDLTLDWGFEYEPDPGGDDGIDDYRCFVIEPELDEDTFVSLVHTRPDNLEITHHMLAYIATSDQDDEIAALEAEDDDPGFECFGGPRVTEPELLAGWAPGAEPLPYEDGHGVRLPEDARLIVQMHYNMQNDPEGTDRTEFDLYFVDDEEHPDPTELVLIPQADLDLHIDAGDAEAEAGNTGPSIPVDLTMHGIAPHMHLLGTEIRAEASTGDGDICLIDVPDWDFDWQGFYLYEEPLELTAPIETTLTCRYDNSADNQPPGRSPQDVTWGDGTYDEMCLMYYIVERPPGF